MVTTMEAIMRKSLSYLMAGMISLSGVAMLGCSETVSHKETDKPNWTGGRTHTEETTVKNPDGSYTTEKSKTKTP